MMLYLRVITKLFQIISEHSDDIRQANNAFKCFNACSIILI